MLTMLNWPIKPLLFILIYLLAASLTLDAMAENAPAPVQDIPPWDWSKPLLLKENQVDNNPPDLSASHISALASPGLSFINNSIKNPPELKLFETEQPNIKSESNSIDPNATGHKPFVAYQSPASAAAQTHQLQATEGITADELLAQAIQAAPKLKIAAVDVDISRAELGINRAAYYPTLQARLNTEYLKGFDNTNRPVTAVGNSVIPSGTRFQHAINLSAQYTVFDFGSRRHGLDAAKMDIKAKQSAWIMAKKDILKQVLDIYEKGLKTQISLDFKLKNMTPLLQQIYTFKKRLYESGNGSKLELAEAAIQLANQQEDIQQLENTRSQVYDELAFLTQQTYTPDATPLAVPAETTEPVIYDPALDAEVVKLDMDMAVKAEELAVQKRKNYPRLVTYSYYNVFGFNPDNWIDSVEDIKQRTFQVGVSLVFPLFDGFANRHEVEKKQLELTRLHWQRQDTLQQLTHTMAQLQRRADNAQRLTEAQNQTLENLIDKEVMLQRLSDQQLVEKTRVLKQQLQTLTDQLDQQLTALDGLLAQYRQKMLANLQ
jgi:outer membrane protein TolC